MKPNPLHRLHISEAAHLALKSRQKTSGAYPSPPQPKGCILILKSGKRYEVEGWSITAAKHCRRMRGSIPLRHDDGSKDTIRGSEIMQILPLY